MEKKSENMWDVRYRDEAYVYGIEPNEYLREKLEDFTPGKALFVAEGEGRNAVYTAQKGWEVSAFDTSVEGKKKATKLAKEKGVEIDYRVGNLPELGFEANGLDAIVFIFAHLPISIRADYHAILISLLKPGGIVVFEGFSKNHPAYQQKYPNVGGPRMPELLFSLEEVKRDFKDFEIIELEEKEVELNEGKFHSGTGMVIRFTGRKNA